MPPSVTSRSPGEAGAGAEGGGGGLWEEINEDHTRTHTEKALIETRLGWQARRKGLRATTGPRTTGSKPCTCVPSAVRSAGARARPWYSLFPAR